MANLCTLAFLFLYFSWSLVAFWPSAAGFEKGINRETEPVLSMRPID